MLKYQTIFLLVWASTGQICGGQIFGGGGRPPIPRQAQQGQGHPPPRGGGILQPNIPRGGIFHGGQGVGPGGGGGREGLLHGNPGSDNNRGQNKQKDRVRVGPIVFDAENLNFDDDDDYANGDDDAYRRPQLGLDLSNVFTPLVNFAKLSGKSFETFATMLEKQANLLLGKIAFLLCYFLDILMHSIKRPTECETLHSIVVVRGQRTGGANSISPL